LTKCVLVRSELTETKENRWRARDRAAIMKQIKAALIAA
jgi:hypothetical protein